MKLACKDIFLADDVETCENINECDYNNGSCSQICENHPGTFMCPLAVLFAPMNLSVLLVGDIDHVGQNRICLLVSELC